MTSPHLNRNDLLRKVRDLPHQPGVYLFKDLLGRVIYVGKARSLHRRVAQYFHPSRRTRADRKTRALIESIRDLEVHTVGSEAESILLEGKLIKEYRPKYNISFRDDKRFLLVKVNLNEPWPRFQTTRLRKDDGARYFGPFPASGALRTTLNLMRKKFHLRSCRPLHPGETDFKHCLDHIIKNCSAPCVGRISREDYLAKIEEACRFLEGRNQTLLAELESEMKALAQACDFERAVELRNLISDIRRTTAPTKKFARNFPTNLVPEEDLADLQRRLQLPHLPTVVECFDISNISTTHLVASMVCFRNGRPDPASYRRYRIRGVEGQNDFASMAEAVRRRYSRVLQESGTMPDLIVVDGGKGQLSAAMRELTALGHPLQPIIGLAKKREEIFRPSSSQPLILPPDSGALRMLQRIRDEAHRTANGFHQLLMKRRIAESLLDDCPGISQNRKTTLLQAFRSIDRLRQAPVEEIAALPGIGLKLAQRLKTFLNQTSRPPRFTDSDTPAHPPITYQLRPSA